MKKSPQVYPNSGGFFMEKNRNTVEDKALYYGLQALLETRHSS